MKKISSFVAITLLTFTVLQMGLGAYLKWRVANGAWIESVASKRELLRLRKNTKVIFLGTSTTQNHFNTHWMTQHGLESFNYGLPGRYWEDFPSVIKSFESVSARQIVLSLPARVFITSVSCPSFRTFYDLRFFIQFNGVECLPKFNLRHLFPLYSDWPFIGGVFRPSKRFLHQTRLQYGFDLERDPRAINYVRGNELRSVVTFKNGDGVVLSDSVKNAKPDRLKMRIIDARAQDLNPEALRFLRLLAAEVQKQGKSFVLILEPRKANETILIDTVQIHEALGPKVPVYANHAWSIPTSNWADFMHLKPAAAQVYTELVSCQLKHPDTHLNCAGILEKLTSVLP